MELELIEVTDDHAFVVDGPIACVIWRRGVSASAMRKTEALGDRALASSPKGAGLLFFPEDSAPPQPLRELSTEVNARLVARGAVGVAGVLRDRGFLGDAQRGIARGMALLAPQPYPFQLFATARAACDWLGTELRQRGVSIDPKSVAERLERFRRGFLADGGAFELPDATGQ